MRLEQQDYTEKHTYTHISCVRPHRRDASFPPPPIPPASSRAPLLALLLLLFAALPACITLVQASWATNGGLLYEQTGGVFRHYPSHAISFTASASSGCLGEYYHHCGPDELNLDTAYCRTTYTGDIFAGQVSSTTFVAHQFQVPIYGSQVTSATLHMKNNVGTGGQTITAKRVSWATITPCASTVRQTTFTSKETGESTSFSAPSGAGATGTASVLTLVQGAVTACIASNTSPCPVGWWWAGAGTAGSILIQSDSYYLDIVWSKDLKSLDLIVDGAALATSAVTFSPTFTSTTSTYTLTLPLTSTQFNIKPTWYGSSPASGTYSWNGGGTVSIASAATSTALAYGGIGTSAVLTVTSWASSVYTFTITQDSSCAITTLLLTDGFLTPSFAFNVMSYSVDVNALGFSITVTLQDVAATWAVLDLSGLTTFASAKSSSDTHALSSEMDGGGCIIEVTNAARTARYTLYWNTFTSIQLSQAAACPHGYGEIIPPTQVSSTEPSYQFFLATPLSDQSSGEGFGWCMWIYIPSLGLLNNDQIIWLLSPASVPPDTQTLFYVDVKWVSSTVRQYRIGLFGVAEATGPNIDVETWVHLCFSHEFATNIVLYRNGVEIIRVDDVSMNYEGTSDVMAFGNQNGAYGTGVIRSTRYFISNFRFWTRKLTALDVRNGYFANSYDSTDIALHWSFAQVNILSPTVILDLSGNGRDLTKISTTLSLRTHPMTAPCTNQLTFLPTAMTYTVHLPPEVPSLTVTVAANVDAVWTWSDGVSSNIPGTTSFSPAIPANNAMTPLTLSIKDSNNGHLRVYTIDIHRYESLFLSGLTIAGCTLTPSFVSTTMVYNVASTFTFQSNSISVTSTVGAGQSNVWLSAGPGYSPQKGTSGTPTTVTFDDLDLAPVLLIGVYSASSPTQSVFYTVTFTRTAISSDGFFSSVVINAGALTTSGFPRGNFPFIYDWLKYGTATTCTAATCPKIYTRNVVPLTMTPTLRSSLASFKWTSHTNIDGTSGQASTTLGNTAAYGVDKTITITVQSEKLGATVFPVRTSAYTFILHTPDPRIFSLSTNLGTLTPAFDKDTTTYSVSVAFATSTASFTPTMNTDNPSLTVAISLENAPWGTVASTQTSSGVPLASGLINNITLTSTSADPDIVFVYTFRITRGPSTVKTLDALTITTLSAATPLTFLTNSYSYGILTIPPSETQVTVTSTKTSAVATWRWKINSGSWTDVVSPFNVVFASHAIVTSTTFALTIEVTAQDGTSVQAYTVNLRWLSDKAELTGLLTSLSTGLDGPFDTPDFDYSATVPYTETTCTFTPTAATAATINVQRNSETPTTPLNTGIQTSAIALDAGANTDIKFIMLAEDGVTTHTYVIHVTRTAASSVKTLSSLVMSTLSAGTPLSFSGAVSYGPLTIPSTETQLTVTGAATNGFATWRWRVNSGSWTNGANGTPFAVIFGTNSVVMAAQFTFTIEVTAQDLTTQSYSVTLTWLSNKAQLMREAEMHPGLDVDVRSGRLGDAE